MIRQKLIEIATKNSIYDEIIDNIIRPNFHLKPELISELSISFLENEEKLNKVIGDGYFLYYFIRAVKNNVHSNTSPFHKNTRIKENIYYDNIEIPDDDGDIIRKIDNEEKYLKIDSAYTKIPKTHFTEFVWHEYFTKDKTYREIASEVGVSHCLIFHEVKKLKNLIKEKV
jgi:hypothetical protein